MFDLIDRCQHGTPRCTICYECFRQAFDSNKENATPRALMKDMPPNDIIEAERKVSEWFKSRNIKSWQLGGSRNR